MTGQQFMVPALRKFADEATPPGRRKKAAHPLLFYHSLEASLDAESHRARETFRVPSKSDGVEKGPLTHRLAVPPLPKGEGQKSKSQPSPLGRGIEIKIAALSLGEKGDRKAVGEGSLRG